MPLYPLWKTSDEFPGSISLPYGVKTSHTWHEIGQILRIINDLDIETFVELGVHVGGLASILLPVTKYRNFNYFGIERDESIVHPAIKEHIYIADVMESVGTVERVIHSRRAMIYCDNGNKIQEMNIYQSILKTGDVIACHDYFGYFGEQFVVGLKGFGWDDGECGCKPEVWPGDLQIFSDWNPLPSYLLDGTRIMGFVR